MNPGLINFYEGSGHCKWPAVLYKHDRVKKMLLEIQNLLSSKNESQTILDIGTGTGDLIYSVRSNFRSNFYYGCDIANKVIERNASTKRGIEWSVQDFNKKTTYKKNFFDLIIAGEIIEHLYDTDYFLYEINRIIKKGGILIISTPNLASWIDRLFLAFGLQPHATEVSNVTRKFGRETFYKLAGFKGKSNSAGHLRCFTKQALKSMLQYYGFEVIKNIPCHSHHIAINIFISKYLPDLSQNTLFICKKK